MDVIEAPGAHPSRTDVFLGGGISNCPNWQEDVIDLLKDVPGIALNPRREGEYTDDIAYAQITWEYHALRTADTVFFWFPMETLCPITLFELGVFTQQKNTRLIVGAHPEYARRFDVVRQLELARPEVVVQDSVRGLVEEYKRSIKNKHGLSNLDDCEDSGENAAYDRVERIVLEELELLIDNGTIIDLRTAIETNYRDIHSSYISTAIANLMTKYFVLSPSGRLLAPVK